MYVSDTRFHGTFIGSLVTIRSRLESKIELGFVSITVTIREMVFDVLKQFTCVNSEKKRTEIRPLGHAEFHIKLVSVNIIN